MTRSANKAVHTKARLDISSLAYAIQQSAELVGCVLEGFSLADVFERQARQHGWPDAVRGAVRDLTSGCLRDFGRGELVLNHLLHKSLPPNLQAILLVALHRLRTRPQHAHTTVDQAVEAFAAAAPGLRGLANGVLRNALRQKDNFDPLTSSDPVARHAHPQWWINKVQHDHPDHWEQILDAGNQKPPMSLRLNRRHDPARTMAALAACGIQYEHHRNGALILTQPLSSTTLPGYAEGWLSVQDTGAQWAANSMDLADGQRVLDACAAPGGKAAHILESAHVQLTAVELDRARVGRIQTNLDRLGLRADKLLNANVSSLESWWDGKPFDRILADVPCSASGVVRRHPDIKWLRRPEDVARFATQQGRILKALWPTLKPAGKLLYVTCSVFDAENNVQIEKFCLDHPDAHRLPLDFGQQGYVLPNSHHDGFFYALVQKA